MSFRFPMLLLLLVLPVVLAFWLWARRGQPLVIPFDHGTQRSGRHLRALVVLSEMALPLLLAVTILLLAAPRRMAPPRDQRILTNILFCLDVSGSMTARIGRSQQNGEPLRRYDAAMLAIQEFCSFRDGDAFGLTIFGNEQLHWLPPTRDLSAIKYSVPFLDPETLPRWFGGTEIGAALDACRKELAETQEGDRAIILVTDGSSADLGGSQTQQFGARLQADRVRVYCILIGSSDGADVQQICDMTGGRLFEAGDPDTLTYVFREIDQMQKARFKAVATTWVRWDRPFLLAGLSLLALYAITQLGLRFTPW